MGAQNVIGILYGKFEEKLKIKINKSFFYLKGKIMGSKTESFTSKNYFSRYFIRKMVYITFVSC